MLEFRKEKNGVYTIHDGSMYIGAISRNGRQYTFLAVPFFPFDKDKLEQVLNRIKELEYDAHNLG